MDIVPLKVIIYRTSAGRSLYQDWLDSLDRGTQDAIIKRLARVRRGLLGDSENLGGGIWELKLDIGPGYRIYFGREGLTVVVLLSGGDKKGQTYDIARARGFWAEYLEEHRP